MGGIFAAKVFEFADRRSSLCDLLNITAGIGAMIGGVLDDRVGALPTIRVSLIAMVILGIAADHNKRTIF